MKPFEEVNECNCAFRTLGLACDASSSWCSFYLRGNPSVGLRSDFPYLLRQRPSYSRIRLSYALPIGFSVTPYAGTARETAPLWRFTIYTFVLEFTVVLRAFLTRILNTEMYASRTAPFPSNKMTDPGAII